jgi:hypothetical protein
MIGWPLRYKVPKYELSRFVQASKEAEAVKADLLARLDDRAPEQRDEIAYRCWSSILREYVQTVRVHSERLVAGARLGSSGRSDDDRDGGDDRESSCLVEQLEQHMANYVRRLAGTLGVEPETLADALARELTSLLHPTLRDLSAAFVSGWLASRSGGPSGRAEGRSHDLPG